ncbi:unnamed protein product [Mycena citricolor]|uniref:Secreted protein n=1 Tax=Mycena citricolor TaxID=2018698 RepID=A0AAD2HS11_9AGAR|nr:unnamed protein product [Mycena citricolor]
MQGVLSTFLSALACLSDLRSCTRHYARYQQSRWDDKVKASKGLYHHGSCYCSVHHYHYILSLELVNLHTPFAFENVPISLQSAHDTPV